MKRVTLFAVPFFLLAVIVGVGLFIHRRRASWRAVPAPHVEVTLPHEQGPGVRTASVGAGVEMLAGYDEQHEEEQEARHGALLHIDVARLNVGQI